MDLSSSFSTYSLSTRHRNSAGNDAASHHRAQAIDERRLSDPDKSALVALTVDAPRFLSEFKTRMARVLG